ncbi:MAG: hypothetical protein IPL35_17550 [Sphingobacteriales bacterium]|nr:hypothetical protein [Sphingobacteriales bacterium]
MKNIILLASKNRVFAICMITYFCVLVQAQEGADTTIYFNKTYFLENDYSSAFAILKATNGKGYVFSGVKFSLDANNEPLYQLHLTRTDEFGNIIWTKYIDENNAILGLTQGDAFIKTTNNENSYLIAYVYEKYNENGSYYDTRIVKVDAEGNIIWIMSYDDGINSLYINQLIATKDGGYLFVGDNKKQGNVNGFALKTDATGNLLWLKDYELGYVSRFFNVIESPDGGYVLAGRTEKSSDWLYSADMQLLKTDSLGNMQWEKKIGIPDSTDCAAKVAALPDGSFLIHGCKNVYNNNFSLYIAKCNYTGDLIWEKDIPTPNQYGLSVYSSTPLINSDGSCIGVSATENEYHKHQATIFKHSASGEVLWQKFLTVNADKMTYLKDIERTADGGFVACGFQYEPPQFAWVVKLDSLGNTCSPTDCDSPPHRSLGVGHRRNIPHFGRARRGKHLSQPRE